MKAFFVFYVIHQNVIWWRESCIYAVLKFLCWQNRNKLCVDSTIPFLLNQETLNIISPKSLNCHHASLCHWNDNMKKDNPFHTNKIFVWGCEIHWEATYATSCHIWYVFSEQAARVIWKSPDLLVDVLIYHLSTLSGTFT